MSTPSLDRRINDGGYSYRSIALSAERLLLQESEFAGELCRERKRAERSGRVFVLMLVENDTGFGRLETGVLLRLAGQLRETDVVGWYRTGMVAGAILTEFDGQELAPALESIRHRVRAGFHGAQPQPQSIRDSLQITFHKFPDEWNVSDGEYAVDLTLRPDLRIQTHYGPRKGVKRALDFIGSAGALMLLSPLFGAIAIAIRLTSKGPILFRQQRVGLYGRLFTMYKFRSMLFEAKPDRHQQYVQAFINGSTTACGAEGIYKLTNDTRITPLGKFLRRTSLDELPQFFNVLRGEMSLVGPRPPLLYEVEAYAAWHRRRLLEAKPGLTGLWQVTGRSKTRFNEMVRLDLRYARSQSVWLDVMLLVKTLRVLVSDEGAR